MLYALMLLPVFKSTLDGLNVFTVSQVEQNSNANNCSFYKHDIPMFIRLSMGFI